MSNQNNNLSTSAQIECLYLNIYECFYWDYIEAKSLNRDLSREKGFHIHHIIPVSSGGNNERDNLVKLTPDQHRYAHYLLSKSYHWDSKIVCTMAFMKRNNYQWSDDNSEKLSELIRNSKAGKNYTESVKRGWQTWNDKSDDPKSRSHKAWKTRRDQGNDKNSDFSPEAVQKRKNSAKIAKESYLMNSTHEERSAAIKRGWETRRAREALLTDEEKEILKQKRSLSAAIGGRAGKGKTKKKTLYKI